MLSKSICITLMWIRIPRRMCSQRPKAKLVETRVQRRSLVLTQNLLHQMHLERQRLQRPTQAKRHSTTFLRHLRRSHRTRLLMQPTHPLPGSASRTGLDLGSVDSRPASRSCSPNLPDSIHSHHKSPYHQVLLCHWRRNTPWQQHLSILSLDNCRLVPPVWALLQLVRCSRPRRASRRGRSVHLSILVSRCLRQLSCPPCSLIQIICLGKVLPILPQLNTLPHE